MKQLRHGIVLWLCWAGGHNGYWFSSMADRNYISCHVCARTVQAGPSAGKHSIGIIQHGLNHIRSAGVRRVTIEALETLAELEGEYRCAELLLGPSPSAPEALQFWQQHGDKT